MTTVVRLLPRAFTFVPRVVAAGPVHWRRRIVLLTLLGAVLASVYMFWLRDSSLVRVERVQVVGLASAPDAARLRGRLIAAATGMTTLHVNDGRLRSVVAGAPVVRAIAATPDFPHGLTIRVTENRPVALLSAGGHNVPVAADGTLLPGVDMPGPLPTVRTGALPTHRMGDGPALDRVSVAAAAPPALLPKIASISVQPGKGYVAQLSSGPAIWLGGLPDLEGKWAAAAAVLAQSSSQGASYVDVRLPERPVAGGVDAPSTPQVDPVAPAPGAIPGSPDPIPASPTDGVAPGQATPPQTTQTVPQTTTQPATPGIATAPQNVQP
jgi:cell division protein FtsQ